MTSTTVRLPKVSEVHARFPLELIKHLRQVVAASSPSDAFACYCNMLEWLTSYLDSLANSIYLARPIDEIDETVEKRLRGMPSEPTFGLAIDGLRAFAASTIDFAAVLPDLDLVLRAKQLPPACGRLAAAFKLIQNAREELEVPPRKLPHYLQSHLQPDKSLPKCTLERFLSAFVPFRNKGHGHQAEETWFPRDPIMYEVALAQLEPAVDELLTWEPFCQLLSSYEVVNVESSVGHPHAERRAHVLSRPRVADGVAPLGASVLLFEPRHPVPDTVAYIARRTEHPNQLEAVVRYFRFPRTLQSSEQLAQRYADIYLHAYLDRGLITPEQRQAKLAPKLVELALPERDWKRVESEIQEAINFHSSDEPELRAQTAKRLAGQLGPRWSEHEPRIAARLDDLLTRRKNYIFEQIENNVIVSFDQLRRESELSEPDLRDVLGELEQESRVRPLVAGSQSASYYKAQDPSKPTQLRTILTELREQRARVKTPYPAPVWRLIHFCAELLADDGLTLDDGEIDRYAELFVADRDPATAEPEDEGGSAMIIRVGERELRANSVRELLTSVWRFINEGGLDTSSITPMLLGRTRYLFARTPTHANGTPFKHPIEVDDVVFEGNLGRDRAIIEMLWLLSKLDIPASSPGFEQLPPDSFDEIEPEPDIGLTAEAGEAGSQELSVEIVAPGHTQPTRIHGPTVRRFFTALLNHLVTQKAPLAEIVPVATGRVRYLLADEPYHGNERRFDSMIEVGGYFMNTAYTYDQALAAAKQLIDTLGWQATVHERPSNSDSDDSIPLEIRIGDLSIHTPDVPSFLRIVMLTLFEEGILRPEDVPYKSGRVRYLISEIPIHDHGREFIRPVEIDIDGNHYFIETNVSRQGALDLVERLIASKRATAEPQE